MFQSELVASFIPRTDNLKLLEELIYWERRSKQLIVIPVGFVSDGASVPQVLWGVMGHPFSKQVREAAVLHDFLYYNNIVSRAKADQIFYDALRELGMEYVQAQSYYIAVRSFGGLHY